ncbi:TRAP transporter small permease subunit [Rhizobium sp. AQ_MP]|uniref:TRAP transporter small permease subunit n=1 Tax=Rhizobium sp. AQ_MP TaxID=2761536 RepID=UPI0032B1637B
MAHDIEHAAGQARSPSPAPGRSARLWLTFVDGLAVLGTILIGVLMVIICTDILARNAMGSSLPLVSELGALLLVMIVCLQLPATVRADRLARTEVFYIPIRERHPKAGAALSCLFNLVGSCVLGAIAWASLSILVKDFESGEFIGVTGIATLPTYPFRILIFIGIAVSSIQFLVQAVAEARSVNWRGPSHVSD